MTTRFIHLRLHTEFSVVDSVIKIKALIAQAIECGMPAIAVTDESNFFGLIKFQKAAEAQGVKPIYGADLWLKSDHLEHPVFYRLSVLVKDKEGYANLTQLISYGFLHGLHEGKPSITWAQLAEKSAGLIVLSCGIKGEIGQLILKEQNQSRIIERLQAYRQLFGDCFYLEVSRLGREDETYYIEKAQLLALEHDIPLVATNEVCFLKQEDFDAHEVRVCINESVTLDNPNRSHTYTDQQYFRNQEEMCTLFHDIPSALENTVEIAKRCTFEVTLGVYHLPNYPIPAAHTLESYFSLLAEEGLKARFSFIFKAQEPDLENKKAQYFSRLREEVGIINQMGFAGYFLIVMDFIQWAKNNDIPVGPGRGSGAGSIVAYALKITDLDPIAYDLLFERFLNPERVSLPDFDVDFCMLGRDRVIDYVAQRYGRQAVSQIITFGTMAAKAVVRDVGRVLGKPYGFIDKIAKMIPFEIGMTLKKALEQEVMLQDKYDTDEEVREVLDMAMNLEGLTRNVGKHAGGVVIAPSKLTDFAPLYCDEHGDNLVTQFDKDDVESVGLVKFDFLGLRTLTIIDWAVKRIHETQKLENKPLLNIEHIPLVDEEVFELLQRAETTAIFQLESRGMKELIRRLKPNCFEDIIALVALFRPGPLQSGMVDDFINRKHGRAQVDYPHPDLEPILSKTYGVILYQEQVMQIAQVLAGYTLGGADMLRRAMGKKKPEEMAKQREIFVSGASAQGINTDISGPIFDLMEKFAGYGFNKSHSAAYALVSYQTAWLKTHYPSAFMASVLSADIHNTDKMVGLIEECQRMQLKMIPPSVNLSEFKFIAINEHTIVYGLGAIKGVGEGPIEAITATRKRSGEFSDLYDFCLKVDIRKLNKRCFEALIKGGGMDCLGLDRANLMANLPNAIKAGEQQLENRTKKTMDLFSFHNITVPREWIAVPKWSEKDRLKFEQDTLGLFLTGHPLFEYLQEIKQCVKYQIKEAKPTERNEQMTLAGYVSAIRTMRNKKGEKMAFVSLDDPTGRIEVSFFADLYAKFQDKIQKDTILIVEGNVSRDAFTEQYKMLARNMYSLEELRHKQAKYLVVKLMQDCMKKETISTLETLFIASRGGNCHVKIAYETKEATVQFYLGKDWRINPSDTLLNTLRTSVEVEQVDLIYHG